MTRIKIKNENGEWETMPIIKGEPGEKGIPGEKGEKGDESYPIGTIVEYEGDTIPSGFELVEDNSASVIVSSTESTTGEEVWIQRGKNLFNPNTDVELIDSFRSYYDEGEITQVSGYNGLKIRVKPNTTYSTKTNVSIYDYHNLCYFDENMVFLTSEAFNKEPKTFTTPDNCVYVTIAIKNTYTWFELEEGTNILPKKIYTKTDNGYEEFYNEENREVYLTEEIRIGTWLGKTLYRKVIQVTLPTNGNSQTISVETDIETMLPLKGFAFQSGGTNRVSLTLPYVASSGSIIAHYDIVNKNIVVSNGISWMANQPCYIIYEYTKTTD